MWVVPHILPMLRFRGFPSDQSLKMCDKLTNIPSRTSVSVLLLPFCAFKKRDWQHKWIKIKPDTLKQDTACETITKKELTVSNLISFEKRLSFPTNTVHPMDHKTRQLIKTYALSEQRATYCTRITNKSVRLCTQFVSVNQSTQQLQQKHEIEKTVQTAIWAWAVIESSHFIRHSLFQILMFLV